MIPLSKVFRRGPTLREFYTTSIRSASHSRRTAEAYAEFLNHWETRTSNPKLPIEPSAVFQFGEALLTSGLHPGTVNKHLRALRRCLNVAHDQQVQQQRVRVKMYPEPEPEPRIADDEQLSAIYWACSAATWPTDVGGETIRPGDYWRALVVLLFNIGLRHSEFVSVRWREVDFDRSTISVRSGKTRKYRAKPLHTVVGEHLTPIRGAREFIFGQAGQRNPSSGDSRRPDSGKSQRYEHWYRIQKRAGIAEPLFEFHELRATCGTAFFEQSPAAAQEMLGHSSVETTRRHYAQLSPITRQIALHIRQPAAFYVGDRPRTTIKIGG